MSIKDKVDQNENDVYEFGYFMGFKDAEDRYTRKTKEESEQAYDEGCRAGYKAAIYDFEKEIEEVLSYYHTYPCSRYDITYEQALHDAKIKINGIANKMINFVD